MEPIDRFQSQLKEISQLMSKGSVSRSELLLKQLQKQVRSYIQKHEVTTNDQLRQIQIAVYNNLACIFQKKGKYKSSLYHLELAQRLEGQYLDSKYNGQQMPSSVLQKLSTTYSNLSAIQSKLGNPKQALKNIEFAIDIISKSKDLNSKRIFIFLFFNYAVLLERNFRYSEASKYALDGLELTINNGESTMPEKYEQLLTRLKSHLARQHLRREKEIRKYSKAETGVFKEIDEIHLGSEPRESQDKDKIKKYWINTLQKSNRPESKDNSKLNTFSKERFSFYKSSLPKRSTRKTSSLYALEKPASGKVKSKNFDSVNASHQNFQSNRTKTNWGIVEAYGMNCERKHKSYSMYGDKVIDIRVKERRRKLEKEIDNLGQKNEALEKVIQKMCVDGDLEQK